MRLISLIVWLCVLVPFASAQGVQDANTESAMEAERTILRFVRESDLSVSEGTDAVVEVDTRWYQMPRGERLGVQVMGETENNRPSFGDMVLDIAPGAISWLGLADRDAALDLLDGFYLNRQGDGVGFVRRVGPGIPPGPYREAPAPEPDVNVQDAFEDMSAAPEPNQVPDPPAPIVGAFGPDLWRLHGDIILRRLDALRATEVVLDVPLARDGSYPAHATELHRFLQRAARGDISVWVRVDLRAFLDGLIPHEPVQYVRAFEALNIMAGEASIAGLYVVADRPPPAHALFSPVQWDARVVEALEAMRKDTTSLRLGADVALGDWGALTPERAERLVQSVDVLALRVSEADAAALTDDGMRVPHLEQALDIGEDIPTTEEASAASAQNDTGAELRFVLASYGGEGVIQQAYTRGAPGRAHFLFQGDLAVILVLDRAARIADASSFFLDYQWHLEKDELSYYGREAAAHMQALELDQAMLGRALGIEDMHVNFSGVVLLEEY